MSFTETFLTEFDQEMQGTRSIIALVPDSLLEWKAHPTLNSIGWVASHLADTLSWVDVTLNQTSFDIAPVDGTSYQSPVLESSEQILKAFDENLATARSLISNTTDEQLDAAWTLLQGGNELFTKSRRELLKNLLINHIVHHRAFLIAYLRMNDIECPGLYG